MKVKVQGAMVEWYPNCHCDMTDAEWAKYREQMDALRDDPLDYTGLPVLAPDGTVAWSGGEKPTTCKTAEVTPGNLDPMWDEDAVCRIAAVARRLYTEDRMDGDTMRNAAQMLHAVLDRVGAKDAVYEPHGTYDARLR